MQQAQKQATPQGKKRKQISMELKLEIVTNALNLKPSELAAKYDMASSTIGTIMDNKAKIMDHFKNNLGTSDTKRIRLFQNSKQAKDGSTASKSAKSCHGNPSLVRPV